MGTSRAPLSGLFTLESGFIKSFGERSLIVGKCVGPGSDSVGNDVGVRAFKNLLVKDCPPILRPPLFGEGVTHFSKNGRTILRTKDVGEFHGDSMGEQAIGPDLLTRFEWRAYDLAKTSKAFLNDEGQ